MGQKDDPTDPSVSAPLEGARMRHQDQRPCRAAPSEAREGCSGLVGDACARQLDGVELEHGRIE